MGRSLYSPAFKARHAELRARGFRPIQARVALARHACRLCRRLLQTQQPYHDRAGELLDPVPAPAMT